MATVKMTNGDKVTSWDSVPGALVPRCVDDATGPRRRMTDQGAVIVEPAEVEGAFMVMFPDGTIKVATSKTSTEKAINAWLRSDLRAKKAPAGIAVIEWR